MTDGPDELGERVARYRRGLDRLPPERVKYLALCALTGAYQINLLEMSASPDVAKVMSQTASDSYYAYREELSEAGIDDEPVSADDSFAKILSDLKPEVEKVVAELGIEQVQKNIDEGLAKLAQRRRERDQ